MGRLSESLREAIRDCGLSQAEIAKRAGIDQSQLSRFLSGDRSLRLDTVDRVASVLGWTGDPLNYILVQSTASSAFVARRTIRLPMGTSYEYVAITKHVASRAAGEAMILLWQGESLPEAIRADFSKFLDTLTFPLDDPFQSQR